MESRLEALGDGALELMGGAGEGSLPERQRPRSPPQAYRRSFPFWIDLGVRGER